MSIPDLRFDNILDQVLVELVIFHFVLQKAGVRVSEERQFVTAMQK